jgi:hypothetical protein
MPLQPGVADEIIAHQGFLTKNDPNSAELVLLNAYTQQANMDIQAGDPATIEAQLSGALPAYTLRKAANGAKRRKMYRDGVRTPMSVF